MKTEKRRSKRLAKIDWLTLQEQLETTDHDTLVLLAGSIRDLCVKIRKEGIEPDPMDDMRLNEDDLDWTKGRSLEILNTIVSLIQNKVAYRYF